MTVQDTTSASVEATPIDPVLESRIQELVEAGVFYGSHKSKTNPKVRSSIMSNRGGIEIIDALRIIENLDKALKQVAAIRAKGGTILLVGTQPTAQAHIKALGEELGYPAVLRRWLGGLLTNFKTIGERRDHYLKLKEDFKAKAFEKYTKKERLDIEKQIEKMAELFGGIENLKELPQGLIIIDPSAHRIAVAEARQMGIPVIAFGDTTSDPDRVDCLVIGNTKSRASIAWFLEKVGTTLKETPVPVKEVLPAAAEEKAK